MSLDAHIVSHTHWDREWYHPLERFRQRLVALIDELLDDPPRDDESFLLDGQAIVLEDYVAIRPDRGNALAALLSRGRLEAGPWYVLADELIPSGEAIVRNLLTGRRILRRFAAAPPNVLYCPDSFGHPAMLPAIARGFGLGLVVLWRGYGGAAHPKQDAARWSAANGESVTLYHLPPSGYEFGSQLPVDAKAASDRWTRMREVLAPRAVTGVVLIPNGADHHARQAENRMAISNLEAAATDTDRIHGSSLGAFATDLLRRVDETRLARVTGELRDSYGYTWALQGTFATRAHEKRLNALAERLLLRDAEPWAAMAGHRSRDRRALRSALVDAAWTTLLQAHPHDTLCGCSIDEVAFAMEGRLLSAVNQGEGIRDDAIDELIGHDRGAARTAKSEWKPFVLIRNPAPRPRAGVAIISVEQFLADVPVGPGSAPPIPLDMPVSSAAVSVPGLGKLQTLDERHEYSLTESPRHYPDNDLVSVTEVAAWVESISAYGIQAHSIDPGKPVRQKLPEPVKCDRSSLSNSLITVRVADDGSVSLEQPSTGRRIAVLFEIIDEHDEGDLYTPSPRPFQCAVEFRGARRVHRGPLRGELALSYRINDPAVRGPIADLSVGLVLDAGAPFLRIRVTGENKGTDHRLRFAIRTDIQNGETWADAAFGPVLRTPIIAAPEALAIETPPKTAPLHRYVSTFDTSRGFTVFSDGLAEYEASDTGSLIVTLVRAVGQLSRNDIPERPGHAGWPKPTPAAQCLGPFGAELAIALHGHRTPEVIDEIERMADDVLCPLVGTTLRSALDVPKPVVGPELRGRGLGMSSIKTSEDGEWLVLRCVNLSLESVDGEWMAPFDVREAHLARLDEMIMSKVEIAGRSVPFTAGPRAIVTLLVR